MQSKFGARLAEVDRGIERDGAYAGFRLHLGREREACFGAFARDADLFQREQSGQTDQVAQRRAAQKADAQHATATRSPILNTADDDDERMPLPHVIEEHESTPDAKPAP